MLQPSQRITWKIPEGTVHIWTALLNMEPAVVSYCSDLLSPDEQMKAGSFRFKKDEVRYILGRAILRNLASAYLKCPPEQIKFSYNRFGKPRIAPPVNLKFNLSHSDDLIAIGFTSGHEIGIDLERIRFNLEFKPISEKVFSRDELQSIDPLRGREAINQFYTLWTRKEAFIKGTGFGLSMPVQLSRLNCHTDRIIFHNDDSNVLNTANGNWSLCALPMPVDYKAAVAVKGKLDKICIFKWEHPFK